MPLITGCSATCSTTSPATTQRFVLLDVHSYNHRRDGPEAPPTPQEEAPDINIGTFSMPRDEWAFLLDPLMEEMRRFDFNGRQLDVRENIAFQGKGEQTRFVHDRYPGQGCAIALEFKKFFMDEWTGEPDPAELRAMRDFITHSAEIADGVAGALMARSRACYRSGSRCAAARCGARSERPAACISIGACRFSSSTVSPPGPARPAASRGASRSTVPPISSGRRARDDGPRLALLDRLAEDLGEPGMPLLVMLLDDLDPASGKRRQPDADTVCRGGRRRAVGARASARAKP